MLSVTHTVAELAEKQIVNRAVPIEELDAVVADCASRLRKRSAFALAWTKRILNRNVAAQINWALDASTAYEFLNFMQIQRLGFDSDPTELQRKRGLEPEVILFLAVLFQMIITMRRFGGQPCPHRTP